MVALVKSGLGREKIGLEDVPVPHAGPGEVRVAVQATGICGTDLHIVDDEFPITPPVVMGHEVSGTIDEAGSGVEHRWLGQRVALETYASTCGTCGHCRSGQQNLCPARRSIGSHAPGGFAPYIVVPVANIHRVHDSVSVPGGALYEPLACVAHTLCDPAVASPGDSALVVGPGTVGLLAAQVLRAQGAQVALVGTARDHLRLSMAKRLGMIAVDIDDLASVRPDGGFDLVAECSGSQSGIASALQSVRKGGCLAVIGLAGHPIAVEMDLVCLKEIKVISGFASTSDSWMRAERLVAGGYVGLDPLVTGSFPLVGWQEAFARTRAGDCVKLVINPSGVP